VRRHRVAVVLIGVVLVATAIFAVRMATAAPAATGSSNPVTTILLKMAHPYKPQAAPGTTDDYHCTLFNPHVTKRSYIISSQFFPGSPEVHHAALYLVSPSLAATAERDNEVGKGWTCFGEGALPGTSLGDLSQTPLLSFWAPGHGADKLPQGTGVVLPAGSLVIMQVHFNLLVGDQPVDNSLVLHTVPIKTPLLPLHLDLMLAPPDIPCPAGVTGPLCDRAASLANQGQRFGQTAVEEVDGIEALCGHNPSDPPVGDSTSCTSSIDSGGYIDRVQAHMHLLGRTFKMVLNPGTPEAKTVLDVPDYDFHDQRSYNLATPIPVKTGEPVQITCTYDPTLAQELPTLRQAPPHFVTWGDGSTDEMCIGIAWTTDSRPDFHAAL
jgi:hypothetical protein